VDGWSGMEAMVPKSFLDADLILLALDPEDAFRQRAARRMVDRVVSARKGVTSSFVREEVLSRSGDRYDAACHLIDQLELITPNPTILSEAESLSDRRGISFADALLVTCASHAGCSELLTEKMPCGHILQGIQLINPFA